MFNRSILLTTGLTLKKAGDAVRAEGGVVMEAVASSDGEERRKTTAREERHKTSRIAEISETATYSMKWTQLTKKAENNSKNK